MILRLWKNVYKVFRNVYENALILLNMDTGNVFQTFLKVHARVECP